MNDRAFLDTVTDRLVALPAVRAVALGGSRAQGTHTPASDWDLAVYYRGDFTPAALRAIGWEGEGNPVLMTGPATTVFEGDIEVPELP